MLTLPTDVAVVNVGLPMFADSVRDQGRPVQQVDWSPPAGGDADLVAALTRVYGPRAAEIDAANAEVVRRLDEGVPTLTGVSRVSDVLPGLGGRTLLHCGPSIGWERVCDPLRRSMRAAVVAEGWASDVDEAGRALADGTVTLAPANAHDMVVPMASAIGPSAPVWVVDCPQGGTRAYAPINQGPGEVPWFGRETPAAIERLRFLRDVAGPALARVVDEAGPLDVFSLAKQGVAMGDDLHMRTQATTNLLIRTWLPQIAALPSPEREHVARFLSGNHLFFLTVAMAGARSLTAWAGQVRGSSIVTTMSRNGTDFGIRLAGSDTWHITDSPPVGDALYNAGMGPDDAAPDIGDSAVLELTGLGGPAAGGSPAVAGFLGGTMAAAAEATERFARISAGRSSRFTLPPMGFVGTPLGVDVRRVVELGIRPQVTTGILHAHDGSGQVGAGVATAPAACFEAALKELAG
ncbi:DUF1116 domain-containing protein [Pseudonocardia abyssalis]|uniref:DUF1116 domain-containing protein n=1 Tax=Pseudonocardia abyssalis TaxID=2792008 RepID=A0ABS6UQD3_9PSEU|nr:DUF1116 domain-containing protein [Pseudonocardia abyssalis]MBW0119289.1 DUF1116 domain-containing protein [Pseudonocardia abyssalis]MBW0134454.1 DUF1116 domain-containing protein [Pseudonocardia abyssalis]